MVFVILFSVIPLRARVHKKQYPSYRLDIIRPWAMWTAPFLMNIQISLNQIWSDPFDWLEKLLFMHYSLDTSIYTIRLSYTGNTSHKCCKWNMKWWTQDEHYTPRFSRSAWSSSMATQEKLMQVSKHICLFILEKMVLIVQNINFIMVWLSRADFINSFKNHTDIGRKNCGAFADATLVEVVEVFINSHIVNNTIMQCFLLICT